MESYGSKTFDSKNATPYSKRKKKKLSFNNDLIIVQLLDLMVGIVSDNST